MPEILLAEPSQLQDIYDQRWRILSQPAGLAWGTQWDRYDDPDIHPETIHAVAMDGDQLVGSGRIHVPVEADHELRVRYMAVESENRGQRIGQHLLSLLEDVATDRFPDADTIRLTARQRAESLYRRFGYRAVQGIGAKVEMSKPLFVPSRILSAQESR